MLEEILKKKSIGEEDLKVLSANLHRLSEKDKARFGLVSSPVVEEKPKAVKKPKVKKA